MADIPIKFYKSVVRSQKFNPSNPPELEDPSEVVNPPGTVPTTLFKLLGDVSDRDFIGKNGFVPVVNDENLLTLEPLPQLQENGLISGGIVQWTGIGYVFNVSGAFYRIGGVSYESQPIQITLATPDVTNDRIDVFAVSTSGVALAITGTPSGSPIKPQINPQTQLELTSVIVGASTSTPTLTEEVIYDENTEWTGSKTGTGTVAFNSAVNPFQGSLSIEATNIENGLKIRLTDGSDYDISTVQTLGLQINLKATMGAGINIGVTFLNSSGSPISTELILNHDKSLLGYQFVGIALSQFTFTSFNARAIEFRYIRKKGTIIYSGFFLDIIKLEGGINPPLGVSSFLGLSDTPSTYSGQGGKTVAVKSDESGLEFVTGGGGGISGSGTTNEIAYFTGASSIGSLAVATYPSLTELSYVKGVTSALQTQINGKQATIAGTLTDTYVATIVAGVPTWAIAGGGSDTNKVSYNAADGKTATEKAQARTNIGSIASTPQTVATTGTINDLAYTSNCIVFTGASAVTLTGLVAGQDGEEVTIVNYSNALMTIAHENAGSSANNRFRGNCILARFGHTAIIKYRATLNRWIVISGWFLSDTVNGAYTTNQIGIGVIPESGKALKISSSTNTSASGALLVTDLSGNQTLNCAGSRNVYIPFQLSVGTTATPIANVKLTVRGSGTTTNTTLRLEDSAGALKMLFLDNGNIQFDTTTGNKIGTTTTQKLAFWNKTPIVQPTTAITGATLVGGGGTTITATDTFGGYTIQQIAAALINTGILA